MIIILDNIYDARYNVLNKEIMGTLSEALGAPARCDVSKFPMVYYFYLLLNHMTHFAEFLIDFFW